MANLNAGPILRFENGGILTITKSASALIVLNLEPGSLRIKESLPDRLEFKDRGVPQIPIEGDLNYAEFEFQYKCGLYISGDMRDKLMAAGSTTTGQPNQFDTIEVKIPVARGGSTGHKHTLTLPYLSEPIEVKPGKDFDIVTAKFKCPTNWVTTTY